MENDGWEDKDVLLGTSVMVPPVWKSSKLRGWPSVVSFYSSGDQLLYMEVQYMFTLDRICMGYLCFSEIHKTMTWVSESLTCLYDLLMHAYTHMFTFIYSVRLNGCLFHVGGGGGG